MSAIAHARAWLIVSSFIVLGTVTDGWSQENLDRNQSGPKLFAASCAQCHKSARGLAKGRISFTLSYYLRQHYTSGAETAQVLTAYLQSVDTPPAKGKAKAKGSTAKVQSKSAAPSAETRMPTGSVKEERPVRPPAKVPARSRA